MKIGGLGNIIGTVLNVVGMVYPPAKIAATVFNMVLGAANGGLKGALSGLMQNFGMPKFIADMVGAVGDKVVQQLQKQTDPEVDDAVKDKLSGSIDKLTDEISKLVEQMTIANLKKAGKDPKNGKVSGGSWLLAIAEAMGKVLGDKAAEMVDLSDKLTQAHEKGKSGSKEAKQEAAREANVIQTKFQAVSQEYNLLSSAFSTAIKSLGEGSAQMARKQ